MDTVPLGSDIFGQNLAKVLPGDLYFQETDMCSYLELEKVSEARILWVASVWDALSDKV